jgi:hypothetical protein
MQQSGNNLVKPPGMSMVWVLPDTVVFYIVLIGYRVVIGKIDQVRLTTQYSSLRKGKAYSLVSKCMGPFQVCQDVLI